MILNGVKVVNRFSNSSLEVDMTYVSRTVYECEDGKYYVKYNKRIQEVSPVYFSPEIIWYFVH